MSALPPPFSTENKVLITQRPVLPAATSRRWTIDILVVEDDEADRSLITDVLKRHPKVSAMSATDAPEQALADLARGRLRPDLIFLDINMPRLNGFKFLEALRQIPAMRTTPVVVLTTSRMARDVEDACTGGVSLYVVKPDTYEAFKTRLGSVIEQALNGAWGK